MKFVFDPHQQYQLDAVSSVADLFTGQPGDTQALTTTLWQETSPLVAEPQGLFDDPSAQSSLDLDTINEIGAVGNNLVLDEETVLENLQRVQDRNGLEVTDDLIDGLQFDIEMETGTGKTYVYLRTIFELAQQYSFRKFIILVPSVAIREGVKSSISLMKEHFRTLYPAQPFDSMVYSGKTPEDVRSFATSTGVQIMVMTIDSLRGDANNRIIHQQRDRLGGLKPIEFLQAAHPVVIMDEPQNMESLLSQSAVGDLNPMCTLRYSATHRQRRNTVYRLDPVDAHELGLVKQIVVAEAVQEGETNTPYIKLVAVKNKPKFQAQLELVCAKKDGSLARAKKWVTPGKDLAVITKNPAYQGNWRINEISVDPQQIELTNHDRQLQVGESIGGATDDIYREMIRETIREHLRKEAQVRNDGVKVISLFFIDKVVNYLGTGTNNADADGRFVTWFDQILEEERAKNSIWAQLVPDSPRELRSAYFAQMSKGKGSAKTTTFVDSSGSTAKDDDAYKLIMQDKARLLSMDEPVRFVFTHSALREGWDNPNVFQICTLREMGGETERRQTIGRGLRLPVNQEGQRIHDQSMAQLTVIANESYRQFADALQNEYKNSGVAVGYVRKGEFAKISMVENDHERALGSKGSEKIWNQLQKAEFISKDGVVLERFQPEVLGFTLGLSREFSHVEDEIIDKVIKCRMNRMIRPKRNRVQRTLNKEIYATAEFERFWEAISRRTTYRVSIDRDTLVEKTVDAIKRSPDIDPVQIRVTRAGMQITRGGTTGAELSNRSAELSRAYPLPDIVTELQEATSLTRKTIIDILIRSGRLADFSANPNDFTTMVRTAITGELSQILVEGIQYEQLDGYIYELRELQADGMNEKDRFLDQMYQVKNTEKTDFDYVVYDSDVERRFAKLLDDREDVRMFMKLPANFKIDTPVGPYNPDWAVVKHEEGEEKIYMIRETKSSLEEGKRRSQENMKISSARKHFAAISVDYEVSAPTRWGL